MTTVAFPDARPSSASALRVAQLRSPVLTMVVPSRGRPANVARLIEAFASTADGDHTSLRVVVDSDDPELAAYRDLVGRSMAEWLVLVIQGEHRRLNPILNAQASLVACTWPSGFVGFMGDDHVPRTNGWDRELVSAIGARPGVAYGNDLLQRQNLPTAVVMSSSIVRWLGYMSPPPLLHLYMDDFWKVLGLSVGNFQYRDDVIIEHVHPAAGKAPWDAAYQVTMSAGLLSEDGQRFTDFLAHQWPADLARLKGELGIG